MTPEKTNAANGSERNTLHEMFPWLTFLLVFLCLTSLFGESRAAKGSLVEALGVAALVPAHSQSLR